MQLYNVYKVTKAGEIEQGEFFFAAPIKSFHVILKTHKEAENRIVKELENKQEATLYMNDGIKYTVTKA